MVLLQISFYTIEHYFCSSYAFVVDVCILTSIILAAFYSRKFDIPVFFIFIFSLLMMPVQLVIAVHMDESYFVHWSEYSKC